MHSRGQGRHKYSMYIRRATTGETYFGDYVSMETAMLAARRLSCSPFPSHNGILEIILEDNIGVVSHGNLLTQDIYVLGNEGGRLAWVIQEQKHDIVGDPRGWRT